MTFLRPPLLVNVRYCALISANMPSGRSVLFRAFDRHCPLPAWFPFSSRASSCMISSLHTISHVQIFANYTLKQDSSSNLAACDVFGQQEQRCVQGFLRARYQVAGHNKSIMWPCRVWPPRAAVWDLYLGFPPGVRNVPDPNNDCTADDVAWEKNQQNLKSCRNEVDK